MKAMRSGLMVGKPSLKMVASSQPESLGLSIMVTSSPRPAER